MTAIIGYKSLDEAMIYLASDSQGSNNFTGDNYGTKVFQKDEFSVAICGSYRFKNIFEHEFTLPEKKEKQTNDDFIYKDVRSSIIDAFIKGNAVTKEDEAFKIPGEIIFAFRDKIYLLQGDTSILESEKSFMTSGSGKYHTQAVVQALSKHSELKPEEILTEAINICSEYVLSVGGKVNIIKHKYEKKK